MIEDNDKLLSGIAIYVVVYYFFFVYFPSTTNFLLPKRHFPNNAPFLSGSTMAFPLFSISPPSPKASTFISRFRVACSPSSAVSFFFFHLLLVERTFIKLILGDPLLLHSERWGCRSARADTSFRKSFFLLYAHRDSVRKQRKGKKGKWKERENTIFIIIIACGYGRARRSDRAKGWRIVTEKTVERMLSFAVTKKRAYMNQRARKVAIKCSTSTTS